METLRINGCACPFGSKFDDELNEIQKHEPKLYNAVNNIFGKSYEYTRKYKKFKEELKEKNRKTKRPIKPLKGQINMF